LVKRKEGKLERGETNLSLSPAVVVVFLASICGACAKHVLLLRMLILIKKEGG
jgi:hypothetical protein